MSERRYDPAVIEPKWQARWKAEKTFAARRTPGRKKAYILDMFPYPSGAGLHVGHPEGYTATDIVARYKRMRGWDVLHPMGWDAFGLPAEQYAIQTGTHPKDTTKKNIETFRRQLESLGFSYDWDREIDTTDPAYVKWTQWIFLRLFRRGLAFQAETPVNWCEALGTVLANEEIVDGKSERGGHPVIRVPLRQWILKITAYADRLLADLEGLDWPETKKKQEDWIGRSEGCEIDFTIPGAKGPVRVFTTRPDTIFGATYLVLAPEHPLVLEVTTPEHRDAVVAYRDATAHKSDMDRTGAKEKTGVFTGAFAENPASGARLPVWIADFVLGHYGTGAIMSVPAHDARDFEFARAMRLPVLEVVSPDGQLHDASTWDAAFTGDGVAVRSGLLDGLRTPEAKEAMIAEVVRRHLGAKKVNTKLRDWVFARQRYWGEPIPIYFPVELAEGSKDPRTDPHTIRYDEPLAVDEAELPLLLPELTDFRPGKDPAGPLARAKDWRYFEREGRWFARETNTMPQWAGSCWYYLRFLDPHNDRELFSKEAYDAWMPVDLYVGGAEHSVLHLLYARFWHKVLFDEGVVSHPEPFQRLVHQGLILGENAQKMSKSLGNVVNPDAVIAEHGADALRTYEMFMGPLEAVKPWQTHGVVGVRRFLDRVFAQCTRATRGGTLDDESLRLLHKTIRKVTDDIEAMRFNTAVSAMMILTNRLAELETVPKGAAEALTLLVSPFAPHLAEEVWASLGHEGSIAHAAWPTYDEALTIDDEIEIGIQVNGRVRSRVKLSRTATEADARRAVADDPALAPFVAGKTEKKFLYVPGKIINVVVA